MTDLEAKATHSQSKISKKRDMSVLGCSIREKHVNVAEMEAEPDMNAPTHRQNKISKKRDMSVLGCSIREKHVNTADEMQEMEADPDMNAPTHRQNKISKKRDMPVLGCSIREKHVNAADEMQAMEAGPDMNSPTMEEKLAGLEFDGNAKNTSEKEAPPLNNIPRADSVHVLLKQALHAQDHALLFKCLSINDEKVITKSVAFLTPSDALKLLEFFLPMIKLRGAVLKNAIPWMKMVIFQHASVLSSQESFQLLLNSLNQSIDSRTSMFRPTADLFAYGDCLIVKDPEANDENTAPAVIYQDTDSDDEEVSSDALESEDENEGLGAMIDSGHDSGDSDSD